MKKMIKFVVAGFSLLALHSSLAASVSQTISPIGEWKTIDDTTGQPKAIVKLWETADQTLYGRILKIYPSPGHDQHELCTACEGERHNKPIVGMVILEDLKQDQDDPTVWSGGSILDPKNGKVYHSKIQVIDNGDRLNVRGYIGTPLFGRTQTWLRVSGHSRS